MTLWSSYNFSTFIKLAHFKWAICPHHIAILKFNLYFKCDSICFIIYFSNEAIYHHNIIVFVFAFRIFRRFEI